MRIASQQSAKKTSRRPAGDDQPTPAAAGSTDEISRLRAENAKLQQQVQDQQQQQQQLSRHQQQQIHTTDHQQYHQHLPYDSLNFGDNEESRWVGESVPREQWDDYAGHHRDDAAPPRRQPHAPPDRAWYTEDKTLTEFAVLTQLKSRTSKRATLVSATGATYQAKYLSEDFIEIDSIERSVSHLRGLCVTRVDAPFTQAAISVALGHIDMATPGQWREAVRSLDGPRRILADWAAFAGGSLEGDPLQPGKHIMLPRMVAVEMRSMAEGLAHWAIALRSGRDDAAAFAAVVRHHANLVGAIFEQASAKDGAAIQIARHIMDNMTPGDALKKILPSYTFAPVKYTPAQPVNRGGRGRGRGRGFSSGGGTDKDLRIFTAMTFPMLSTTSSTRVPPSTHRQLKHLNPTLTPPTTRTVTEECSRRVVAVGTAEGAGTETPPTTLDTELSAFVMLRQDPASFDSLCIRPQAATTAANRRRVYTQFTTFCESQPAPLPLDCRSLLSFLSFGVRERQWTTSTVHSYRAMLCTMLRVFKLDTQCNIEAVAKAPLRGIDPSPCAIWERRSSRILSPDTVRGLLTSSPLQHRVFFELLLACAGRAADALPSVDGELGTDYLRGRDVRVPLTWTGDCAFVRVVDFNNITKATHYNSVFTREDHLSFVIFSAEVCEYLDRVPAHAPIFTLPKSVFTARVPGGLHNLKHTAHSLFCRAMFEVKTPLFSTLRSIFCKHLSSTNRKVTTAHYSDSTVLELCIRQSGIHYAMTAYRHELCRYAGLPSCVPPSLLREALNFLTSQKG